jgi:ABC-type polysaccharide/polyol phosphate export permease
MQEASGAMQRADRDRAAKFAWEKAIKDVVLGTILWRPWYVLGLSEIRQRYRRSTIGPFWVTLSVGIQAAVMGLLLSYLFKTETNRFLPFVCISLVTWTFLSSALSEGATGFISMSGPILQVSRPLWTYIMLLLWRNALIYVHMVPVFFIPAFIFGIYPTFGYLLIPLGLALLIINAGWMALVVAIISARYRDVPLIVQSALNVLVWLTPVYYHPDQVGAKTKLILQLNPLTSIMEVARGPFLNQMPPISTWMTAAGVAIAGWLITLALYARTRHRIAFWV